MPAFSRRYARALAATGKPTDAVAMFQKAIDRGAATPDLFDAVGSLYAQSGDWDEAQLNFQRPSNLTVGMCRRKSILASSSGSRTILMERWPLYRLRLRQIRKMHLANRSSDARWRRLDRMKRRFRISSRR